MSLAESRGETNSRGERSEMESRGCDRSTKHRYSKCNYRLTTNVKKKSTTRGEKTGAAQEMKERKICKRVWEGGRPSHCFRLESWPKWSCEAEQERRSQRHYWDTCQPPWDVRCEREEQSEGGWKRGEAEWKREGEGGRRDGDKLQNTLTRRQTSKWSSSGASTSANFCITLRLKLNISHLIWCI